MHRSRTNLASLDPRSRFTLTITSYITEIERNRSYSDFLARNSAQLRSLRDFSYLVRYFYSVIYYHSKNDNNLFLLLFSY